MSGKYDDMILMPHHVSEKHLPMAGVDRAAQFSPFAALTGYDAAVKETARLTDARIELTEDRKEILDRKLRESVCCGMVEMLCFRPDDRKSGGAYVEVTGQIRRIDTLLGVVVLADGMKIPIGSIMEVTLL